MPRSKNSKNNRLEEAVTMLIQNQALFLSRISEMDRINSERFGRIEGILLDHSRILADLIRIVEALPEAVREKFGFRMADQKSPSA